MNHTFTAIKIPKYFAAWLAISSSAVLAQSSDLVSILSGTNFISDMRATGISSDGSVVTGYRTVDSHFHYAGFRWTRDGGFNLFSFDNAQANAISADGLVIVGVAGNGGLDPFVAPDRAFHWTQAQGLVFLGTLNGGQYSAARSVNSDGSVIAGEAADGSAANALRAFRWTATSGMTSLGVLNGGSTSRANSVNGDGAVVVGAATDGLAAGAERAFRWTQTSGMVSLGLLSGHVSSFATAVNGDGSVVVGGSTDAAGNSRAFRWSQTGGMASLGVLNGGAYSVAKALNRDGTVVVGSAIDGTGNSARYRAFRWTAANGMQTVETWLRANGVNVPADFTGFSANGVSADGNVVVGDVGGRCQDPTAYSSPVSSIWPVHLRTA